MPEENYQSVSSLREALGNTAMGCKQEGEFDAMSRGLEELYQRILSQTHVQNDISCQILGSYPDSDHKDAIPETPANGRVDGLHRQISKCLSAMSNLERSFKPFHKL